MFSLSEVSGYHWEGVDVPLANNSAWSISYDYELEIPVLRLVGHTRQEVIDSLRELLQEVVVAIINSGGTDG